MSELGDFLARHPPFDTLDDDARERLAASASVVRYDSGAEIFNAFVEPIRSLSVVLTGRVELWNSPEAYEITEPDEILGVGGVFGYSSLLTRDLKGPRAVASGPVRLCQIPEDDVREVFTGQSGAVFLARQLSVRRRRSDPTPAHGTVDELIRTAPVVGQPSMTVRQAAVTMSDHDHDYVVIPTRSGEFGILTDGDIRARVVAPGLDLATPVSEVMTVPALTVPANSAAADALTLILEHDLTCVPVVGPSGELVGAVGPGDFVVAPAGPSVTLRRQVIEASSVSRLADHARRMPYLVADLVRSGEPSSEITRVLSLVHDAVIRRALELVLASHPELEPDAMTWMSLGSNARREPVLSSDVDSAVSFDDAVSDEMIDRYRAAFREVDDVLRSCGLPIDVNGAIASMPLFARRHGDWRAAARTWLDAPLDNQGMMFTSLLLDGRPIWGDQGLPAVAEVFADLRSHPGTLRLLLAETLTSKARLRSMRDVLARRGGTFDIKNHALTPLVNIARWGALSVGSSEVDTRSRLRAAAGSTMLSQDSATTLVEVFDTLQRIRLENQVDQLDRREDPSDVVTMRRLSPLDRSLIAPSGREIAAVQRRMGNTSQYTPVTEWGSGARSG